MFEPPESECFIVQPSDPCRIAELCNQRRKLTLSIKL